MRTTAAATEVAEEAVADAVADEGGEAGAGRTRRPSPAGHAAGVSGASDDAGGIFPTTKPRVTTISILWGLLGGVEEKNRGSFKPRGPFRTHLARNAWFPIFSPLRPFTYPDI